MTFSTTISGTKGSFFGTLYNLFYEKRLKLSPFGCNQRSHAMGQTHRHTNTRTNIATAKSQSLNRTWGQFSEKSYTSHLSPTAIVAATDPHPANYSTIHYGGLPRQPFLSWGTSQFT